jgi:hypothetical protein
MNKLLERFFVYDKKQSGLAPVKPVVLLTLIFGRLILAGSVLSLATN